ncbi:MAG: prepilin peptidase [Pseudomonadota bacterium]
MLDVLILVIFPAAMIYAAVSDITTMTISNWISLVLIAAFPVLAYASGMAWTDIGWHFAAAGLMLALGFTLFAFNVLGGGDAKLLAAAALWFGWSDLFTLLVYTALFGAPICIFLLAFRNWPLPEKLSQIKWIDRLHDAKAGAPYGVAICAAGLVAYADTPMMQLVGA